MAVIYHVLIWRSEFKQFMQAFANPITRKRVGIGLFVCATEALLYIIIFAWATETDVRARIVNNPGGLFAVLTGIVSVLGVYLTLLAVLDVRNSIVSFADFVRRVGELIDETRNPVYIRMMILTPTVGCLMLKDKIWQDLAEKIKKPDKLIALTCLDKGSEKHWFDAYLEPLADDIARKSIMESRIKKGHDESNEVKRARERLAAKAQEDHHFQGDLGVVEGTWPETSQCYFIANNHRAIVVVPFFLPRPGFNIFGGNVEYRSVQLIGFETSDVHIVETVHEKIESRRQAIRANQAKKKEKGILNDG